MQEKSKERSPPIARVPVCGYIDVVRIRFDVTNNLLVFLFDAGKKSTGSRYKSAADMDGYCAQEVELCI